MNALALSTAETLSWIALAVSIVALVLVVSWRR